MKNLMNLEPRGSCRAATETFYESLLVDLTVIELKLKFCASVGCPHCSGIPKDYCAALHNFSEVLPIQ